MVTLEDRDLFLKAVNDPSSVVYKPEPQKPKTAKPRKGPSDFDVKLDLHGLTTQQAEARVKACLVRCLATNKKRLLVIHGKGEGILRYEIRSLLAHSKLVAQVQEVPTRLGGDGAVLVLLKGK
ncbi:MAG: Smr/MutS family protein [Myxococcota bacterium]